MNKSLLLMICDFLLISVLALVKFDQPEETPPAADTQPAIQEGLNADMVALLQLSLESEEAQRAALAAEKNKLEEQRESLESNLRKREEDLALTQEERDRLAREQAALAAAKAQAEATLEATREERAALAQNLDQEAQRAQALQAELKQRQAALAAAQADIASAQERAEHLEKETQRLSTNLQIVETERELLQEHLKTARTDVEIARVERERAEARSDQLAQGVTQLAAQTEAVQEEMRRAQPVTSNEIFSRYDHNRVTLEFTATFKKLISSREERTRVEAILVRDGGRTFAIFEGSQGPFGLDFLERLHAISGRLVLGNRRLEIIEISFLSADPRLIAVEIPANYLKESGLESFELATEPFRFPRAVLISNELGAYGETDFRLLPGEQNRISVARSLISQLRGEFQPNRGDYVFAQTGRLLGLMVETESGVLLSQSGIIPTAHLALGDGFNPSSAATLKNLLQFRLPPPPRRQ